MHIAELVSRLTPAAFPVIGMVVFVVVFVAITLRTFWPGSAADHERANRLPLEGDRRE